MYVAHYTYIYLCNMRMGLYTFINIFRLPDGTRNIIMMFYYYVLCVIIIIIVLYVFM